ncbi:MAG: hypothetical protein GKR89_22300 [Candidatus Latescibacteria bacterium]|nr:hypothetical protein [Candidatus Latescibacterota bacterium]
MVNEPLAWGDYDTGYTARDGKWHEFNRKWPDKGATVRGSELLANRNIAAALQKAKRHFEKLEKTRTDRVRAEFEHRRREAIEASDYDQVRSIEKERDETLAEQTPAPPASVQAGDPPARRLAGVHPPPRTTA